jgi:acylphosphatase
MSDPDPRPGAEPHDGAERPARTRLEAVVHGRVQGVGYRFYAVRLAARSGLDGWIANQSDGSVRCVAEGTRADLLAFARDLEAGPAGASVRQVDLTWSAARGERGGMAIRSGWHGGD